MNSINKYFNKIVNKETILYGIFGILTTVLNIGLYEVLVGFNLNYKAANLIALVVVKLVAYVVNKLFVFKSNTDNLLELCQEFSRYVVTRGATMLIDYFGLILLVEYFGYNKSICKYVITIIVIIINYFLGKKHVYINKKGNNLSQK